jgi:hypothetical protein
MNPPGHIRFHKYAPWVFRGAVVIAVLAVIITTQLNASHRAAKIAAPGAHIVVPFTGFGGYNWTGKVTTIGAQWSVPTIARDSSFGGAATWIGVQNSVNNQFVQIGIDENDFGDGPDQYQAFWSDLQVGFSPQTFGDVYPGDVIAVSMSRTDKGWSLRFADLTRKLKGKAFVRLPSSVPFTQGEWIQEDPTASTDTSQDLPYPELSTVTFRDLTVNERSPVLNRDDGQVLISSGATISVPTPFLNDAFSLTAPTGDALRYLDDEQHLDSALNQFDVQLAAWNTTSVAKESTDVSSLSAALKVDANALASQSWPSESRSPVAQLIQSDRMQLKNLTSWSIDDYDTHGVAFAKFQLELDRNVNQADALRSTLGLPPL